MKKLIVKSQLEDLGDFERRLARVGRELGAAVWQHERIYVPREYEPRTNQVRMALRTEVAGADRPATYELRMKRHIEESGVDFVHATRVADYAEVAQMLHQLGFVKLTEVSRQRRELVLDAATVIYVDEVEGMERPFLKIEAEILKGMTVERVREELYRTLRAFGVGMFVMQAYGELMGEQMQPYLVPGK